DGLVIHGGRKLSAGNVCGHYDHRIVMALAVAGAALDGQMTIDTAEAMAVTFPTFAELMNSIGAEMRVERGSA
ncbi:MAG: 3-phosphoshikimate 1-carboxyvinyltransferase, partial [Phycisphaerae bacterium]